MSARVDEPKGSLLYSQPLLDLHDKLIVDLFAGGGGASSGIEQALGRMVDIAINHNKKAVAMHEANHPQTKHLVSDVFEVDPREVTQGRPVGLLWASPDCTFHSKARGSKPIRSANKKRRALAWVVTRWAGQVRPDVIFLENVEEFAQWGPLVGAKDKLRPCPKRRGQTFRAWVKSLTDLGYQVEWRELRACDYGAPTIRKRLFLIARCDGKPIVWPQPTHGPGLKPYRAISECIDWSVPMLSIFATKDEAKAWGRYFGQSAPIRPLAENTMKRIARGVKRYVLQNPKPFLVTIAHGDGNGARWGDGTRNYDDPLSTCTTKNAHAIAAPFTVPRYGEREGQEPRCRSIDDQATTVTPSSNGESLVTAHLTKFRTGSIGSELSKPCPTVTANSNETSHPGGATPIGLVAANLIQYHSEGDSPVRATSPSDPSTTLDCSNRQAIVASFLVQNNEGFYDGPGRPLDQSGPTVCSSGSTQSLVAAHMQRDFGASTGSDADKPIGTITADGCGHAGLVASFLAKYYGTGEGQSVSEPIHTIPTVDRFGFVSVMINGEKHYISDIAMRMLQPRELYLAQGFRPGYIIDRCADGQPLTKTEQVQMCGNSVCPDVAQALVEANVPYLKVRELPKVSRRKVAA